MKRIDNLNKHVSEAIAHYWLTRRRQSKKQSTVGRPDQGARSAVTGGAQMDGFTGFFNRCDLCTTQII